MRRITHGFLIFKLKKIKKYLRNYHYKLYFLKYQIQLNLILKQFKKINYKKQNSINKFENGLQNYIYMLFDYIISDFGLYIEDFIDKVTIFYQIE